jgi:hypothetical protein
MTLDSFLRHGDLLLPELGAQAHVPQQICVSAPEVDDGTRTTTVILVDQNGHVVFEEHSRPALDQPWSSTKFELDFDC